MRGGQCPTELPSQQVQEETLKKLQRSPPGGLEGEGNSAAGRGRKCHWEAGRGPSLGDGDRGRRKPDTDHGLSQEGCAGRQPERIPAERCV